jgi:hypothetical protein
MRQMELSGSSSIGNGDVSVQVIAVRDEADAEPLDAILVQTRRSHRFLIEWWGGYASQSISKTIRPEDVRRWPGWRPLTMELPKDWEEGYLRATGGKLSSCMASLRRGSPDEGRSLPR